MRTPAEDLYYLRDSLGTVVAVTDSSGAVNGRYRYEPYGESAKDTTTVSNPFRFAGQHLDSETGLYHQGLRYYDPQVGRWTQKDPLNLFQDPRQVNRYVYAGADPVNGSDPSGAWTISIGPLSFGINDGHVTVGGSIGCCFSFTTSEEEKLRERLRLIQQSCLINNCARLVNLARPEEISGVGLEVQLLGIEFTL